MGTKGTEQLLGKRFVSGGDFFGYAQAQLPNGLYRCILEDGSEIFYSEEELLNVAEATFVPDDLVGGPSRSRWKIVGPAPELGAEFWRVKSTDGRERERVFRAADLKLASRAKWTLGHLAPLSVSERLTQLLVAVPVAVASMDSSRLAQSEAHRLANLSTEQAVELHHAMLDVIPRIAAELRLLEDVRAVLRDFVERGSSLEADEWRAKLLEAAGMENVNKD